MVKFEVDGRPSFEWGGEDEDGNLIFGEKRVGWEHGPVHDMLVDANVTIAFHGHDHFFAKQEYDGIIYQECPMSGDRSYSHGYLSQGGYRYGEFRANSGHLMISVDPDSVTVDYVRSFLPGDGENGEISCSYTIR